MEKQKITITRALAELKLLGSRIEKQTKELRIVDLYQNRSADKRLIYSQMSLDEFEKRVKSQHESIEDLIKRRSAIKSAIMLSNAITVVKISGKDYTVGQAIDRKASMVYEKSLLHQMQIQLGQCKQQIEAQRPQLEKSVETMLNANLGADKTAKDEDYDRIAKPFLEANQFRLNDPLKIQDKIDKLGKSIEEFEMEVDFVLSESNSKTEIEV